jgi:hypothetical protein
MLASKVPGAGHFHVVGVGAQGQHVKLHSIKLGWLVTLII